MLNVFKNLKLSVNVSLLGVCSVLITAVALVELAVWQSGQYNRLAQKEVDFLINSDLDHITQGVYNLVKTENEAVQQQVDFNLNVARHVLANAGGVTLSKDSVNWNAVNQLTNTSLSIELPRMIIKSQWLGQNTDPLIETLVVDEVTKLVGETATIFQRMNSKGDMLRVATTVTTETGKRAIGTYIPAFTPDMIPNPVIESVLKGMTYHGRAYVVNEWYLTAYEPIKDKADGVIGMLYVGVKQKTVESRVRQTILNTKVGKTGYVFVLRGNGDDRGRYIISQSGERDGDSILENVDGKVSETTRNLFYRAILLKTNEIITGRYLWKNPGEPEPRWKIVRLTYYEPWDWVIGTSVYEEELQNYQTVLNQGRIKMTRFMIAAGLLITFLIGLFAVFIAWTIIRPVRKLQHAVEIIINGDLDHVVDIQSANEIGVLAHGFNLMTERLNKTMKGLRENEQKYRKIFENAIEGLFQISFEGHFLNVNPSMAHALGYDSPEDLMISVTDFRHQIFACPEDLDAFLSALGKEGEIVTREIQLFCKDKKKVWGSVSVRLVRDNEGNPFLIEGFFMDISSRKIAEEAQRENEYFLQTLMDAIPSPIFYKDMQGFYKGCNVAFETFHKCDRRNIIGKSIYDLATKEMAIRLDEMDKELFQKGGTQIFETSVLYSDGITHNFIFNKALYRNADGTLGGVVGVITDITEQKKLEDQLRQAQKMEAIGTLAGGIAHDFNNILTTIMGYGEILGMLIGKDSAFKVYIDDILVAAEKAKHLTQRLLAFSRKQVIRLDQVDLNEIIRKLDKFLIRIIGEDIEFKISLCDEDLMVMADSGQMELVLMNLATNARDAMPEGGTLSISTENVYLSEGLPDTDISPGHFAVVSISDTGKGMEAAIKQRIFEPFFTTKEIGKGTGLGLSIVYGIIKQHKGEITVYSEPGKGTAFRIYLKIVTGETDKNNEAPLALQQSVMGTETILLAEDNDDVRRLFCNILEGYGYTVIEAVNGEEAVAKYIENKDKIQLLLFDVIMPKKNGKEAYEEIKKINESIRVLFSSGYTSDIIEEKGMLDKGVNLIMKPDSPKLLVSRIREILDKK